MINLISVWIICQVGVSLILGHFITMIVVNYFWHRLEKESKDIKNFEFPSEKWHPVIVGFLERFLYTSSWLLAKPEFIGVWLILKVAVKWKAAEKRCVYNIFLIGTAISLIFGVGGALLMLYLTQGKLK